MENKDNSNLTSWLNEFYKKTDCLSFFYNQLTFKIANDLKEYQSNFNFILQELSFFLSVASNINCKELSNFKTKYQLYEFDKIDKMVSLFYERIDASGYLKKQYDKLKENNFIKFINYKEWVNNNLYDDLKSSTTTQNGITVFLTSTVVDALQIVHEMAHYLFKHDNAQIDYLFTEGIACLNTLAFCNVMDDYLKNEDICTYFNQELEAIFEKSIDVESIGTYVDIYLKHHKINEKSIEDYCLEFGIEDQTDYLKDEAVDIKGSIDLETLFFNLRYIYSYPLVVSYFKNQDDINLLEVINNYLETNSLNEAALVFEKNYPIKSNDELENMVDDFYTYYTNEEKNKQKMNKIIVVCGPTAVGKTKLSVELAKDLNGEIINADSTQIFKELDIATAKIKESEKEGIPHHLFDIKNIDENYTVYDYQKDARQKIAEILKRGHTPILVGGTGLYIKACLYDYRFMEENINKTYDDVSNEKLYKLVCSIDSETKIHPNNRKRLIRALNYYDNHHAKMDEENGNNLLYDVCFIGLTTDRDILYNRINKRVDIMLEEGLLKEAKDLYDRNIRTKAIMTPIGYKELFPYFDGLISLDEAIDIIKKKSRNYAKKQYTWFNHQIPVTWFYVDFNNFDNTILEVKNYLK